MLRIEIAFAQQIPNKFGLYSLNRNFHYLTQTTGDCGFKGSTYMWGSSYLSFTKDIGMGSGAVK